MNTRVTVTVKVVVGRSSYGLLLLSRSYVTQGGDSLRRASASFAELHFLLCGLGGMRTSAHDALVSS